MYKLIPNNKTKSNRARPRARQTKKKGNSDRIQASSGFGQVVRFPDNVYRTVLRSNGAQNTNGAGVISGNMTNNPSGANLWSSFAALFDSYRVTKMTYEMIPFQTYEYSINYPPLVYGYDEDASSFPSGITSMATALEYVNARIVPSSEHSWFSVRPKPITSSAAFTGAYTVHEGGWLDTATPVGTCCAFAAMYSGSATQNYFTYILHWEVEFRNRN